MITFTNFTGLASILLLIATVVMSLFGLLRIPLRFAALLTCGVVIAMCLPLSGLPLAAFVRGAMGDLSITLTILLILRMLASFNQSPLFQRKEKVLLCALIAMGAVVLYLFALEIGYVDPYRWGFGNMIFLAALFLLALLAFWKRYYVIASCIVLSVLAWTVGWNEANNLWNYLIDPFVAIYAFGALMSEGVGSLLKLRRNAAA